MGPDYCFRFCVGVAVSCVQAISLESVRRFSNLGWRVGAGGSKIFFL